MSERTRFSKTISNGLSKNDYHMLTKIRIVSIFVSTVFAYCFAQLLGALYAYFFPSAVGGSFIGAPGAIEWVVGVPLTLIFIFTLLIHAIGGKDIWWWNVIVLLPVILFEVAFDPLRIFFPLILALIAYGLGVAFNQFFTKISPAFMAKIGR